MGSKAVPRHGPDVSAATSLACHPRDVGLDELERLTVAGQAALEEMQRRLVSRPILVGRRIGEALKRLENAASSVELLKAVPGELGVAAEFDRVLASFVHGSVWSPESWWARDADRPQDRAIVASLRGSQVNLAGGMIEGEIVRRRTAALVRDTHAELRTWAPFADVAESHSYIAAPFVVSGRVAGLIHVDAGVSGRELGNSDIAAVNQFADGLGLVFERLELRARLESQRQQIRAVLDVAREAVSGATSNPLRVWADLDGTQASAAVPETERRAVRTEDKLTAREREVFQLLVGGATNAQIANRLTLSETTVKSHVQQILRKARATNRAQVIAQYLNAEGRSFQR